MSTETAAAPEVVDRGDTLAEALATAVPPAAAELAPEAAPTAAEGEIEGEDGKPKKDTRIPLARHKEILEKEREQRAALERQLAQYQQGQALASTNEEITALENSVLAMEKEYAKLLSDGEADKASTVMAKIRSAERVMTEAKSDMKLQAFEARATENARFTIAVERIEASYPQLNSTHDEFDQPLMAEVTDLTQAYLARGLTPTAALQKAVKILLGTETTRQASATSTQPRVTEKDVAAERKAAAVKKTTEAVGKTPASLNRVGIDSDKLGGGIADAAAVMNMSQKEFAALDEKVLARLRGDDLA